MLFFLLLTLYKSLTILSSVSGGNNPKKWRLFELNTNRSESVTERSLILYPLRQGISSRKIKHYASQCVARWYLWRLWHFSLAESNWRWTVGRFWCHKDFLLQFLKQMVQEGYYFDVNATLPFRNSIWNFVIDKLWMTELTVRVGEFSCFRNKIISSVKNYIPLYFFVIVC